MNNCDDAKTRHFLDAAGGNLELASKWAQTFDPGDVADNSAAFFIALHHLETGQIARGQAEIKALRRHIHVTKKDITSRLVLLPKIKEALSKLRRGHFQDRHALTIGSRRRNFK